MIGPALQVISGRATNPSTTFTAATMDTGDSNTVKFFEQGNAYLLNAWTKEGTLGDLRIRSPLLHEFTQGIRLRTPLAAKSRPLLPLAFRQPLTSMDQLTIELTGGGAETDAFGALIYYNALSGGGGSFMTSAELAARRVHDLGLEVAITSGGTAGQYGGGVAINNTLNILKANTAYAIFGYLSDTELVTIGVAGPDTSNLRVGGPGSTDSFVTRDWFVKLSDEQALPLIPVINSSNAPNTTIDVVDTGTGTSINVVLLLAQLSGPPPSSSLA